MPHLKPTQVDYARRSIARQALRQALDEARASVPKRRSFLERLLRM